VTQRGREDRNEKIDLARPADLETMLQAFQGCGQIALVRPDEPRPPIRQSNVGGPLNLVGDEARAPRGVDRCRKIAQASVGRSQHPQPENRAGSCGANPLVPHRAVDPCQIVVEQGYRLLEVAAPHQCLAEIETRADSHSTGADFAGYVACAQTALDASVEFAAPIVNERPSNIDRRQARAIVDRCGQSFSFGETVLQTVILGSGSKYGT